MAPIPLVSHRQTPELICLKGFPSWKLTFNHCSTTTLHYTTAHEYLRIYSIFKNNFGFFFYHSFAFSTQKNKPPGQGEVRQGLRRSASGVKEKCVGGKGEVHWRSSRSSSAEFVVFCWSTSPWPLTHFSLTPGALLLDPWHMSPSPGGLICQSWKNPTKKIVREKSIFCWKFYIS